MPHALRHYVGPLCFRLSLLCIEVVNVLLQRLRIPVLFCGLESILIDCLHRSSRDCMSCWVDGRVAVAWNTFCTHCLDLCRLPAVSCLLIPIVTSLSNLQHAPTSPHPSPSLCLHLHL